MKQYLALTFWIGVSAGELEAAPVDFGREIAPVLQEKCSLCHGGDAKKPKAGLRLDNRESIESFAGDRPLITAGKPRESSLYTLVSLPHDSRDIMPPPGKKAPLSSEQIATIGRWIEEGARFGGWTQSDPNPANRNL